MNDYIILWPSRWFRQCQKNGDDGPLAVIYGGDHQSQPPLGKVSVGDVIYPVMIEQGKLFVLAGMTVHEIMDADQYLHEKLGFDSKFIKETLWDSYTFQNAASISHLIPRSCVRDAAVGIDGSAIKARLVQDDIISRILLGAVPGKESPLKTKNGKLSITSFQGHFRRLNRESALLLSRLINDED